MNEIFADSAYWIALQFEKDALHERAIHWTQSKHDSLLIVTSDLVLIEFLNYASRAGTQTRIEVAEIWDRAHANREILVIPDTERLLRMAVGLFKQAADKRWSLTDCASIHIMRERGISEALTANHHFEQAGFHILLKH